MSPAEKVLISDGEGHSFQDYERQVCLCLRMAHLEPAERAVALFSRMNSVARQGRLSAGAGRLGSKDGARNILDVAVGPE